MALTVYIDIVSSRSTAAERLNIYVATVFAGFERQNSVDIIAAMRSAQGSSNGRDEVDEGLESVLGQVLEQRERVGVLAAEADGYLDEVGFRRHT